MAHADATELRASLSAGEEEALGRVRSWPQGHGG